MDKYRFFTLLVSKSGNIKPLISENKLREDGYLQKKQELLDYLYSVGLETDGSSKESDVDRDGEMDTEMFNFERGNVVLYLGICNFSNGDLKYLCFIKTKPKYEIVLKPMFVDTLEELQSKILPYIEQSYEDTKLNYLGVNQPEEYTPSKNEYDELLNQAIDNEDWNEATRLQNKYGDLYN